MLSTAAALSVAAGASSFAPHPTSIVATIATASKTLVNFFIINSSVSLTQYMYTLYSCIHELFSLGYSQIVQMSIQFTMSNSYNRHSLQLYLNMFP